MICAGFSWRNAPRSVRRSEEWRARLGKKQNPVFFMSQRRERSKDAENFLRFRETILRFCDINKNREGEFAVRVGVVPLSSSL